MHREWVCIWFWIWIAFGIPSDTGAETSRIVYPGSDGRLRYVADEKGNRIPDFSHAGYEGGGVDLPQAPVIETVACAFGSGRGYFYLDVYRDSIDHWRYSHYGIL